MYSYETPSPAKHHYQRLPTNASYGACRSVETEESVELSRINHVQSNAEEYFNQNYQRKKFFACFIEEQINTKVQNASSIPLLELQELIKICKMVNFMAKEAREQKDYISRKTEVNSRLKEEVEQKERKIKKHKKVYESQIKKLQIKRKVVIKYDDIFKQLQMKWEFNWALRIRKMQQKLQEKKLLSCSLIQQTYGRKKKRRNQIKVPIWMPQHYCTAPGGYGMLPKHLDNDFYSVTHGYNPEQTEDNYSSPRKTSTKMRTQPTDGIHSRKGSKLKQRHTLKYIEDYDTQREYDQIPQEKDIANNNQFKKLSSTLQLKKRGQTTPVFMNAEPEMNKPEIIKIDEDQMAINPKKRTKRTNRIRKVESETVSASDFNTSRDELNEWLKDKEEQQLAVLLEQSIEKEESRHRRKTIIQQAEQAKPEQMSNQRASIKSNRPHDNSEINIQLVESPRGKSSILKSERDHHLGKSPVKGERLMFQSMVMIEVSDQESSKLSKRSNPWEVQRSKYRASYEDPQDQIEQQSDEVTSMKTIPPNRTIYEVSQHEKTTQITPTVSQNSKKHLSHEKLELIVEDELPSMLEPHRLKEQDTGGISCIQLSPMSRNSRDLSMMKKQKVNNDDDNLMSITLAGESRISRQRISIIKNLVQEVEKHAQQKEQENISSEEFDFDLVAESSIVKKPMPIKFMTSSLKDTRQQGTKKDKKEQPCSVIEEHQEDNQESPKYAKSKGR